MHRKCHKFPWRQKNQAPSSIILATDNVPLAGTSVHGLVSAQSGVVPQETGPLTHSTFCRAIIFVDHLSQLIYIYLTQNEYMESTFAAKATYKHFSTSHGVKSQKYHADNGCFADQDSTQQWSCPIKCLTFVVWEPISKVELQRGTLRNLP